MMVQPFVDTIDDLYLLLDLFPQRLKQYLEQHPHLKELNEVILDLGRKPEIRFSTSDYKITDLSEVTLDDIHYLTQKIGFFNTDNRGGIERTLHRISVIRNRNGNIIGVTCRVGRAVVGTIEIIRDIIESGQNILFLGRPGIGKTTKLRETARVLSDEFKKRVIVVDTSNEIAGDGDIPHPGIGYARRMQVPTPHLQHAVMIEAVENHMPQVIIVDEIGTEEEALAARTIAERGVQLVATAHGFSLENLLKNPTLTDLLGGIQSVVLGDDEAKFRGTQKTVLERKSLPTFDCLIEIRERDVFAIYLDVKKVVDDFLRKEIIKPEIRKRTEDGTFIQLKEPNMDQYHSLTMQEDQSSAFSATLPAIESIYRDSVKSISIFPFAVNRDDLVSAISILNVSANIANSIDSADVILTTKKEMKTNLKLAQLLDGKNAQIHVLKQNTKSQIISFLKYYFQLSESPEQTEEESVFEIQDICKQVINHKKVMDAAPRNEYYRRIQHQEVTKFQLNSQSIGIEPNRRVRVYPQ